MIRYREININSPEIFRIFISGCSSAGKTFFAKRLLESVYINPKRVYYFHPDIHEQQPVNWNAIFQAGLPSLKELLEIPSYSCIVLDDLYHECKDSKVIDYLFRVLSSKRKIHVIIMAQRYYSYGVYALNIRNCCNVHVLMRNSDEHANLRVARRMNLVDEFRLAEKLTKNELFPYFVFDKTNHARVTGLQLYIDIFAKHLKLVMKSGLFYLISQPDFERTFEKIDDHLAKYESSKPSNTIDSYKEQSDIGESSIQPSYKNSNKEVSTGPQNN